MFGRYVVYILASPSRALYVGTTSDLLRRLQEHRTGERSHYAHGHRAKKLVYFEQTDDVRAGLRRERVLKEWTRARKVRLIESTNPEWRDLSVGWR
jgi:putative endonuclease